MGPFDPLCARCRRPSEGLRPLPAVLRVLMRPAGLIFPVFHPSAEYCPKCRRAMITPTVILVLFAVTLLVLMPLRYLGIV